MKTNTVTRPLTASKKSKIKSDVGKIVCQLYEMKAVVADASKEVKPVLDKIKNKIDSLNEMESLRLQMAMDRLSKMMSMLSNLLKKMNDTQQSIIANMK